MYPMANREQSDPCDYAPVSLSVNIQGNRAVVSGNWNVGIDNLVVYYGGTRRDDLSVAADGTIMKGGEAFDPKCLSVRVEATNSLGYPSAESNTAMASGCSSSSSSSSSD